MGVIVRSEVLRALDEAEARREKRVPVIIGLHRQSTAAALKGALRGMGIEGELRETERFVMIRLSRAEIQRIAGLTEHVSKVWLDRPVSAANTRQDDSLGL